MSDTDLLKLREKFPKPVIGKLPKVTCGQCSKGSCGTHKKAKCGVCGAWISEAHTHIDYVGHADTTGRLLDVDPEWDWRPKATDPDPALLKAAIESGNPEIVRMVLDNAPPKFERNGSGYPVGFWMLLTIGGVTRPGYGSCPASQADAEKVLIGDALRNAAMRFGVALDLWAKGERADPTAENPAGDGGKAERHAVKPETPRGRVTAAQRQAAAEAKEVIDLGDWQIVVDGCATRAECDTALDDLRKQYAARTVKPALANAVGAALRAKAATLPADEVAA